MTYKERAKRLLEDIPTVFLALKHPHAPWYAKGLAALTVVYALSPIDLIPDFIPVLGCLDDVLILPVLVALTRRLIPDDVFAECRERARGMWENGRPKNWLYAIPVALTGLLVLFLIVRALWRF